MYHLNSYLTDSQESQLFWVKDKTQLTISEFNRRLYDYAFQPKVLNELIPSMSGQFQEIGKIQ